MRFWIRFLRWLKKGSLVFSFLGFFFLNLHCINIGNPMGQGPTGILYSQYKIGISPAHQTETSEKLREGKACIQRIGFFYTKGDASLEAAAEQGSITKIYTIDRQVLNYFLFYGELCTIVNGI